MSITQSPFYWYTNSTKYLSKDSFLNDDIKIILCTSSYTPNVSHEFYDVDITNEVANANNYTTGGLSLTGKTVDTGVSLGEYYFKSLSPVFSAIGGDIVARYFIIYNNTPASNKPLLGYAPLDYNNNVFQDVTIVNTFSLMVNVPVTGWFKTLLINGSV